MEPSSRQARVAGRITARIGALMLAATLAPTCARGAPAMAELPSGHAKPRIAAEEGRAPGPLAGHHAEYVLALRPGNNPGAIAATGRMVFDLADSCAGYAATQHILIDLTGPDGSPTHLVSDYATVESHDGLRLRFTSRELTNGRLTTDLRGEAVLAAAGGAGVASYSSVPVHRVTLPPGTLMPAAHTRAILRQAGSAQHFLAVPLFDGTSADGAEDSFATLGRSSAPGAAGLSSLPALRGLASTRVRIGFFPRGGSGEQMPDFELGLRYFSNGVASELEMNFGDFAVLGTLQSLRLLPPIPC